MGVASHTPSIATDKRRRDIAGSRVALCAGPIAPVRGGPRQNGGTMRLIHIALTLGLAGCIGVIGGAGTDGVGAGGGSGGTGEGMGAGGTNADGGAFVASLLSARI